MFIPQETPGLSSIAPPGSSSSDPLLHTACATSSSCGTEGRLYNTVTPSHSVDAHFLKHLDIHEL